MNAIEKITEIMKGVELDNPLFEQLSDLKAHLTVASEMIDIHYKSLSGTANDLNNCEGSEHRAALWEMKADGLRLAMDIINREI